MFNSHGKMINLREEQTLSVADAPKANESTQTTNQKRILELELVVQRLQHRLRIYEGL